MLHNCTLIFTFHLSIFVFFLIIINKELVKLINSELMTSKIVRSESVDVKPEEIYRQKFDSQELNDSNPNNFIEADEERDERLVVRFVPKFVDYIIFLVQLSVLGGYFYVAFIYDGLGETACNADINSDVPLSHNSD